MQFHCGYVTVVVVSVENMVEFLYDILRSAPYCDHLRNAAVLTHTHLT